MTAAQTASRQLERNPQDEPAQQAYNFAVGRIIGTIRDAKLDPVLRCITASAVTASFTSGNLRPNPFRFGRGFGSHYRRAPRLGNRRTLFRRSIIPGGSSRPASFFSISQGTQINASPPISCFSLTTCFSPTGTDSDTGNSSACEQIVCQRRWGRRRWATQPRRRYLLRAL
jgi:hypothetical protein